mgnify:CR=1 FL=1
MIEMQREAGVEMERSQRTKDKIVERYDAVRVNIDRMLEKS